MTSTRLIERCIMGWTLGALHQSCQLSTHWHFESMRRQLRFTLHIISFDSNLCLLLRISLLCIHIKQQTSRFVSQTHLVTPGVFPTKHALLLFRLFIMLLFPVFGKPANILMFKQVIWHQNGLFRINKNNQPITTAKRFHQNICNLYEYAKTT